MATTINVILADSTTAITVSTGARGPAGAGNNSITSATTSDGTAALYIDSIRFETSNGGPTQLGEMAWESTDGSIDAMLESGVVVAMGEDLLIRVRNATASPIAKGAALAYDGTQGASGRLEVKPWVGSNIPTAKLFLGFAAAAIPANSNGYAQWFGKLDGINTSGGVEDWQDEQLIYAVPGTSSTITNVAPTSGEYGAVAVVVNAGSGTSGILFVRPTFERVPVSDAAKTWGGNNPNTPDGVILKADVPWDYFAMERVADLNNYPRWGGGGVDGDVSWTAGVWTISVLVDVDQYTATKTSDALDPTTLTGWTIVDGTGQPNLEAEIPLITGDYLGQLLQASDGSWWRWNGTSWDADVPDMADAVGTLAIANGGTGSSSASTALTNLGVTGTGVQSALAAATNATGGLVTFGGNIGAATATSLTGPGQFNINDSAGVNLQHNGVNRFRVRSTTVEVTATTASTSTSTGSLTVLGGVGIAGAVYCGSINTDGNANIANLTASGYLEGAEMTAPAVPAANRYRIFAEDNGSGKTRLMVQFATGAAQQIAIEP